MSSEIEYISGWHKSSRLKWRVFSGDLPPSCLTLQLSQSLGTAGTCAEGQMCTDRAHRVTIWPKTIHWHRSATETQGFCHYFQFFISSQAGQCKGAKTLSNTQTQKHPNRTQRLSPVTVLLWPLTHSLGCPVRTGLKTSQSPAAALNSSPCWAAVCTQSPK